MDLPVGADWAGSVHGKDRRRGCGSGNLADFVQHGGYFLQAGIGWENCLKMTIYLVDMQDFEKVNEVYGRTLREPFPARSTVGVSALPKGARIEMEAIARKPAP